MSVNLYYTQKIRGFQQQKAKYTANSVIFHRHGQSLSVDAASDKWQSGQSVSGKYMGNQWEIAAK